MKSLAPTLNTNHSRRRFLLGMVAAPAIILTPGLLMPVKKLWTPPTFTRATTAYTFMGDRIYWITNNGLHVLTAEGIETANGLARVPGGYVDVYPGESLGYRTDMDLWVKSNG